MERKRSNPAPKIAKSQKLKNWLSSVWKNNMVAIMVVGVLAMFAAVMVVSITNGQNSDCPSHSHSAYSVWIEDERVPFRHPDFFKPSSREAPGTHIHNDDGVYHWHASRAKCYPLEDSLQNLDVSIKGDSLTLGGKHGSIAGVYKSEDGAKLHIFTQKWSEQDANWTRATDVKELLSKQPKDGDGVVIIWGHQSEAEIQYLLSLSPSMKGTGYDPHR